ncbi:hypothetical protein [Bacillus cereus]|uniref:hypothetical protein n=1 Tax=Bacillus cereus TaxID=1396 RepID=UPI000994FDB6|nr:hypothetical protein [Bacillus cereus]OPA18190.1 hypothetical protein BHL54_02895 [Bacillus cereus]
MGFHIDEVQAILQEVELDIKLQQPMSISTRWNAYIVFSPYQGNYKELAILRHTYGQRLGTQTIIEFGKGLDETIFSENQLAAFKKIMDANTTE